MRNCTGPVIYRPVAVIPVRSPKRKQRTGDFTKIEVAYMHSAAAVSGTCVSMAQPSKLIAPQQQDVMYSHTDPPVAQVPVAPAQCAPVALCSPVVQAGMCSGSASDPGM